MWQDPVDRQAPSAMLELLDSAEVAVKHSAMRQGKTTHAANHHLMSCVNAESVEVTSVPRGAVQALRQTRKSGAERCLRHSLGAWVEGGQRAETRCLSWCYAEHASWQAASG